jgi:hypothetical protein
VKNALKMPLKTRGRKIKMPLKQLLQTTKNHSAGVVLEAKMRKTNVLKLALPTCKFSLPTAKKFYILGKSAGNGCNFKTILPTLETKKPLPKNRGFVYKTGNVLITLVRKIIFFSFREVKAILSYSPRSYSLFRKLLIMGYLVCSHIVHKPYKPNISNPDLGVLALVRCLQMCAGYFLPGSHPI